MHYINLTKQSMQDHHSRLTKELTHYIAHDKFHPLEEYSFSPLHPGDCWTIETPLKLESKFSPYFTFSLLSPQRELSRCPSPFDLDGC
jgi:hypothetical protein